MDNKTLQQEELEVLESIYGKQWKKEIDGENSYSIDINADVKLYILLNCEYPLNNPPGYQLFAPTLSKQQKNEISLALDAIYLENLREPVLYQWIEKVKELVADISQPDDIDQDRTDMIMLRPRQPLEVPKTPNVRRRLISISNSLV